MALDTTIGGPSSNSYASAAEADAYFEARNNATWAAAADEDKEKGLLYGTSYLDGKYSQQWPGYRAAAAQALDWPRSYAYDFDGYQIDPATIPRQVKEATYELALLALTSPLQPSLDRGGQIKQSTVGPITTVFFDGAPAGRTYPQIATILSRIIGPANQMSVIRG